MNDFSNDLFESGASPAIGHNNPPAGPFREAIVREHTELAARHIAAAELWVKNGAITSEEQAAKLNDFRSGVKAVIKTVENDRKADKKPHDDAGKAVQEAYTPIIAQLKKAVDLTEKPLRDFLLAEQRRKEAEAAAERKRIAEEQARIEAERKAAEAEGDAARAAELEGIEKQAQKEAKRADRAPSKASVGSATGAGKSTSVRRIAYAKVTAVGPCFSYFRDHPDVLDLLTRLATNAVRAGETVPGTETHHEEKVI